VFSSGRRTRAARVLFLVGLAGAVACAEGASTDLGALGASEPKEATEATEPAPKSPMPDTNGSQADSGTDPVTDPDPDPDPGPSDSGTDSATDPGTDAGVDAGPACTTVAPSNACGLVPQCGCAGNETCDVTNGTTGAVSCVLAGGGPLGSYCTSTTQCEKGLTCGYNTCRPYCATSGTACAGAGLGQCTQYYDPSAGTPVQNSQICTIACDLRNPTAACGANNCIWDTTINQPDCDKSGPRTMFQPCSRYNECAQGLACVSHPFFGLECERWCRLGVSGDCTGAGSCKNVYGAAAPTSGGYALGHCQ
jgi:hypothetical protein